MISGILVAATVIAIVFFSFKIISGVSGSTSRHESWMINFRNVIYRISPDGSYDRIFPKTSEPTRHIGNIYLSPDKKYVAYSYHGEDLHIFDMEKMIGMRLTNIAAPSTEEWSGILVGPMAWSADSSKILYSISGEFCDNGGDYDGDCTQQKSRDVEYGIYMYDLETGRSSLVEFPESEKNKPISWLIDWDGKEHFILQYDNQLVEYNWQSGETRKLFDLKYELGQVDLNRQTGQLLALTDPSMRMKYSQIIKFDLKTGHVSNVTAVGAWAESQSGQLSPDGKHIAYVHRIGREKVSPGSNAFEAINELVVDNKAVYSYKGNEWLFWLDDVTIGLGIVTSHKNTFVILDSKTGSVISETILE